ncbi:MAG: rhodanese-like domain-containing protein [Immundisolibacteraceae bacterium]|nr:rhodanese-like domain-containing protein [Immundisolibacteraceae bacterium]
MDFVIANWELFAGVAVVAVLLLVTSSGANLGGLTVATPAQVVQMLNREQALILDLRSETGFDDGHIAGSINVTADNMEAALRKVTRPADQPVVLVTDRGVKTAPVIKELKQADVKRIVEIKGGVQAWRDEQLPLIKS